MTRWVGWRVRCWAVLCVILAAGSVGLAGTSLAHAAANSPVADGVAETTAHVTALRDRVIAKLRADGYSCSLAAPTIVVERVPSWGNYNEETNRLRTPAWVQLLPEEKAYFAKIAPPGSDEAGVRQFFERGVHQWVFVHELGHWWQHCRGVDVTKRPPYGLEYGANRFALAYWREADPGFATWITTFFQGMAGSMPSPVPAGEDVETYFNANYEKLGPSPVYPWFQARMIVKAAEEVPAPDFATAAAETK
jgi:hypothetical protein